LLDGAKDDPSTSVRFLETIKKHSDRLNFLIDDLLTISTLESGQVKLNFQTHQLKGIVNDVVNDLQVKAEEKNTIIHNQVEDNVDAFVDSERIKQVFYNLIDNAIKYGKSSGNVWIECQKNETFLKVCVRDDGPGIPPEARDRIFERFYRIDKARSREQGGTGLGLSIVKHIVQAHGGKAWVESQFGKGSTFYFTIARTKKI
jgi:two-component system phosphate regulon sensor histidine kinase PhoR